MITKVKDLRQPAWNTIVWRYFSMDKFLFLLDKKKLVFPQAKLLTDKNEVTFPVLGYASLLRKNGKRFKEYGEELEELENRCEALKTQAYISSWSLSPDESYGLWKIYLGGNHAGAAIKTNFKSLLKSMSTEKEVRVGKVHYTKDYGEIIKGNDFQLSDDQIVGSKYLGYKSENELRMFIYDNEDRFFDVGKRLKMDSPTQQSVNVDLDTLVHEIYLSPWVKSWFKGTFIDLVEHLAPSVKSKLQRSLIQDY